LERLATAYDQRVNLTVRPVTRLAGLKLTRDSHGHAQGARPSRPAGYAGRYAHIFDATVIHRVQAFW
jgi:hypothetical protein